MALGSGGEGWESCPRGAEEAGGGGGPAGVWFLEMLWGSAEISPTRGFGGPRSASAVGAAQILEGVKCCSREPQAAESSPNSHFSLGAWARLPLERGKKLREVLREEGLLHHFFQNHRYDIGTRFPHAFANGTEVATEPLLNTLDVSDGFVPQRRSPRAVCGTPIPMSVLCVD